MTEHNERWVLNRLIAICRDGERGFRYAANHVRNPTVKALFLEIASQRDSLLPLFFRRRSGSAEPASRTAVSQALCTAGG